MKNTQKIRRILAKGALSSLAAALCFSANSSMAAGFALEDGSARGNAIPGELTAKGGTPGSLYFNPATITELPGTQLEVGATFIKPWADVATTDPYTGQKSVGHGESSVWPIPSAYFTTQLNDSLWFGYGMYCRYGLGAEFKDNWAGRYGSLKSEILSFDFNPNLAWRVNDRLSLAIGISVRYFDIELEQKLDPAGMMGLRPYNCSAPSPYDVTQNFHGDDIMPALDLGLTYKITDSLTFGAGYHSRIKFKVKGDVKWQKPAAVQALAPTYFNDTTFWAENYNPDKLMFGLAWDVNERLTLATGLTYTLWSLYEELEIHTDTDFIPGRNMISSKKEWQDVVRVSFSASYDLSDAWTVYGGYTFDQSPLNGGYPDYLVPGDDRHLFSLGCAWTRNNWTLDLSYFYELVEDYDVKARPASGVFEGKFQDAEGHALAISAIYRF